MYIYKIDKNTQKDTQRNKGTNICCKHTTCQTLCLIFHFNPQNSCRVNKFPIFTDKQIEVQSHSICDLWEMVVQRFKPEWKAKILVSFMVLHAHPLPTPYVLDLILSTASASCNPASPMSGPLHQLFLQSESPPPISKWLIPSPSHVLTQMPPSQWGFSWSSHTLSTPCSQSFLPCYFLFLWCFHPITLSLLFPSLECMLH